MHAISMVRCHFRAWQSQSSLTLIKAKRVTRIFFKTSHCVFHWRKKVVRFGITWGRVNNIQCWVNDSFSCLLECRNLCVTRFTHWERLAFLRRRINKLPLFGHIWCISNFTQNRTVDLHFQTQNKKGISVCVLLSLTLTHTHRHTHTHTLWLG